MDEAARRRFVKRLYIALPESEARLTIVKNLLADMKHSLEDADFDEVAKLTEGMPFSVFFRSFNDFSIFSSGYSGADMRQLCAEAAMGPIRDIDNCSSLDIETIEAEEVSYIET